MSNRMLLGLAGLPCLVLAAALTPAPAGEAKTKDPESKHALDLRVREAGKKEFDEKTKKYGVEVYFDPNGGQGVHISETGSLSATPAKLFKAGEGKVKSPLLQHALELPVRKPTEEKFSKATKRFNVECFKDQNNGDLVYISETGHVAVVPAKFASDTAEGAPKDPTSTHALSLKVRKGGSKDWDKDVNKYGVEAFTDENNGNLIYVCETGAIAVVPGKLLGKDEAGKKDPEWKYGLDLAVRKVGEDSFGKDTKKVGIEVFEDKKNGNLIYICETGSLAVIGAKAVKAPEGKDKSPEFQHAMELMVRKAGEKVFDKKAAKFAVEVYRDEYTGNLIYVSFDGNLAVVSNKEG